MAKNKTPQASPEVLIKALQRIADQEKAIDYLGSLICGMVPVGTPRYSVPEGGSFKMSPVEGGAVKIERME